MFHSLERNTFSCQHDHKPITQGHDNSGHDPAREDDHDHHRHSHALDAHRPEQRKAFFLCILLTSVMMLVEFTAGILFSSLMLVSDAIHMLSHASALGISFLAVVLANKKTGKQFSFGLYRAEILAAFLNGIGLAGFSFWIIYTAVVRMLNPLHVMGTEVTVVATLGLLVNLTTAVILHKSGTEDLNTKSAFLHMLADTFSSVAIVIGGVIIRLTGRDIIDPLLAMVVAAVVGKWSWDLLRDSTLILLERKPAHIEINEIERKLKSEVREIKDVHDIHIWEITSQFICLSAHVILDDVPLSQTEKLRLKVKDVLREHFGIGHTVLQLEC